MKDENVKLQTLVVTCGIISLRTFCSSRSQISWDISSNWLREKSLRCKAITVYIWPRAQPRAGLDLLNKWKDSSASAQLVGSVQDTESLPRGLATTRRWWMLGTESILITSIRAERNLCESFIYIVVDCQRFFFFLKSFPRDLINGMSISWISTDSSKYIKTYKGNVSIVSAGSIIILFLSNVGEIVYFIV